MLFKAMLSLESLEECYDLFEDICTLDEIQSIAKRLRAAKMLKDGMVYNEINEKTGLSTATISRVNRCLEYGDGGYSMILDRLAKKGEKK
jgi:TrpR-related protein YerC/YecD